MTFAVRKGQDQKGLFHNATPPNKRSGRDLMHEVGVTNLDGAHKNGGHFEVTRGVTTPDEVTWISTRAGQVGGWGKTLVNIPLLGQVPFVIVQHFFFTLKPGQEGGHQGGHQQQNNNIK